MKLVASSKKTAVILFLVLGAQVGLWSALLPQLAEENAFSPGDVGLRLMLLAAASTVTVLIVGKLTDRWGRRFSAIAGLATLAAAFLSLAWTDLNSGRGFEPGIFLLLGIATGLLDIAANAVGSDYEREAGKKKMVGLHAAFSAGAALTALAAAAALSVTGSYQTIFLQAALVALIPLTYVCISTFPAHHHGRADQPDARAPQVLRNPLILVLIGVGTICFLGDGILQGFGPLYIKDSVGTSAAVSALGVALFHGASFVGRTLAQPLVHRIRNEASLIIFCTLAAAAGVVIVAAATDAVWALTGMAIVGLLLSPVIPTVYSLIGRAAGSRSGAAIAILTASSYGAFTFGPGLAGIISEIASLKIALVVVICGYALCGALATIAHRNLRKAPASDPPEKTLLNLQ